MKNIFDCQLNRLTVRCVQPLQLKRKMIYDFSYINSNAKLISIQYNPEIDKPALFYPLMNNKNNQKKKKNE